MEVKTRIKYLEKSVEKWENRVEKFDKEHTEDPYNRYGSAQRNRLVNRLNKASSELANLKNQVA